MRSDTGDIPCEWLWMAAGRSKSLGNSPKSGTAKETGQPGIERGQSGFAALDLRNPEGPRRVRQRCWRWVSAVFPKANRCHPSIRAMFAVRQYSAPSRKKGEPFGV